jgi:hypothetical protein
MSNVKLPRSQGWNDEATQLAHIRFAPDWFAVALFLVDVQVSLDTSQCDED